MKNWKEIEYERRLRQIKERQQRWEVRNLTQKQSRRQSWIQLWLHACRHIRSYPVSEREKIFQDYITLQKLPRSLLNCQKGKSIHQGE